MVPGKEEKRFEDIIMFCARLTEHYSKNMVIIIITILYLWKQLRFAKYTYIVLYHQGSVISV